MCVFNPLSQAWGIFYSAFLVLIIKIYFIKKIDWLPKTLPNFGFLITWTFVYPCVSLISFSSIPLSLSLIPRTWFFFQQSLLMFSSSLSSASFSFIKVRLSDRGVLLGGSLVSGAWHTQPWRQPREMKVRGVPGDMEMMEVKQKQWRDQQRQTEVTWSPTGAVIGQHAPICEPVFCAQPWEERIGICV